MKLGVEVVPPRRTDAEGRICEKPRSTTPAEGTTCVPGDAGSDGDSIRGFRKWRWLWVVLGRVQAKCSPGNAVSVHISKTVETDRDQVCEEKSNSSPAGAQHPHPPPPPPPPPQLPLQPPQVYVPTREPSIESCPTAKIKPNAWRERFRKVSAVPAFASPLTPILNPIVGRAQWEIVMRSAVMASMISLIVIGALLSIPVTHPKQGMNAL